MGAEIKRRAGERKGIPSGIFNIAWKRNRLSMNGQPVVSPSRYLFVMKRFSPVASRAGFTLVELLVVIGIIVILMSLLLTAIPAVKESSRKLEAKNMVNQIAVAANAYYTEYAKFPPLTDPNAPAPAADQDQWVGDQVMGAQHNNNALFFTLRNINKGPNQEYAANPRRVVFFEGKAAIVSDAGKPRAGFYDRSNNGGTPPSDQESCLYDPWGKQYGVMLDTTGDDRINLDGVYTDFSGVGESGKAPRKKVGAFAMGKDEGLGRKGSKAYRDGTETSDDVVSWE
jgi:prepilin-type N-terminal cleavage/methylation domain-containing protein